MSEVLEVVKDLPNRKSSGLDGLNGESLKYADPLLRLLLSICYTCMFKHSYMPQSMINSIIAPLVKNKCGNLTDKNNYGPIALSINDNDNDNGNENNFIKHKDSL